MLLSHKLHIANNKSQQNEPLLYDHAHLKLHDQFVALIDIKINIKINFIPSLVFDILKF